MSKEAPKNILVIPGDGAGKEMVKSALLILDWLKDNNVINVNIKDGKAGFEESKKSGEALTEETIQEMHASDAVLIGKFGIANKEVKQINPEDVIGALLSNFRAMSVTYPVKTYQGLEYLNRLKSELPLDFSVIRDIGAGLYKGEPRGIKKHDETSSIGINTLSYKASDVFKLCSYLDYISDITGDTIISIDRMEVLEAFFLWRHVLKENEAKFKAKGKTVEFAVLDDFNKMFYNKPDLLKTIITPNHVGDNIIQTLVHLLSLGLTMPIMYTSMREVGRYNYMFTPLMVLNNTDVLDASSPIPAIASVAQMLRYVFKRDDVAEMISQAITKTLYDKYRTKDIIPLGSDEYIDVSSIEFGEIILSEFIKIYNNNN